MKKIFILTLVTVIFPFHNVVAEQEKFDYLNQQFSSKRPYVEPISESSKAEPGHSVNKNEADTLISQNQQVLKKLNVNALSKRPYTQK